MSHESDIRELRDEIQSLLAAAINKEHSHEEELLRRDDLHIAETSRRDQLHVGETGRRDKLHVEELALIAAAIESRDIIGQAKGVMMVTMRCTADEAFRLLKAQSQHENRPLVEIADEVAERARLQHRPVPSNRQLRVQTPTTA